MSNAIAVPGAVQTSLFDLPSPDPKHLARREGPQSSAAAAQDIVESGVLGTQCQVVYEALLRFPDSTGAELAQRAGLELQMVRRRLPNLSDLGKAVRGEMRRCTVRKKISLTWRAIGG